MLALILLTFLLLPVGLECLPPVNLRIESALASGIKIAWDNSDLQNHKDVTFAVEYKQLGQRSWQRVLVSNKTEIELTGLQHSIWYQTKVRTEWSGEVQESEWTKDLLFVVPPADLLQPGPSTPINVTANLLSPTSIYVSWSSGQPTTRSLNNSEEIYYLVDVEIRNGDNDKYEELRQVRAKSSTVLLDQLPGGSTFRIRVRAKTGNDESSLSDAVIVKTLSVAELFTVNDIHVTYLDDNSGSVNLTWDVPENIKKNITGYVVWFATSKSASLWAQQYFSGDESAATLYHLSPDTTYYLTVETQFKGGAKTESAVFQFKTPAISPMNNVEVVFQSDPSQVVVRWTLKSYVVTSSIKAYELKISQGPGTSNETLQTSDQNYRFTNLKPGTRYYVRFKLIYKDGRTTDIQTVYNFQTMNNQERIADRQLVVECERISPGMVRIKWRFPLEVERLPISESLVLFTDSLDKSESEWIKIMASGEKRETILTGLEPGKQYFVKVLPRYSNTTNNISVQEPRVFSISPDSPYGTVVISELVMADRVTNSDQGDAAELIAGNRDQALCLSRCRLGRLSEVCAIDHVCIADQSAASSIGICVPKSLIDDVIKWKESTDNRR